jgi:hypothetical protein
MRNGRWPPSGLAAGACGALAMRASRPVLLAFRRRSPSPRVEPERLRQVPVPNIIGSFLAGAENAYLSTTILLDVFRRFNPEWDDA